MVEVIYSETKRWILSRKIRYWPRPFLAPQFAGERGGAGNRTIGEIVQTVGLDSLANRTRSISSYSAGEKVLYRIAAALLTYPNVLILDGPFGDLSENDYKLVENVILKLQEEELTMLYDCEG